MDPGPPPPRRSPRAPPPLPPPPLRPPGTRPAPVADGGANVDAEDQSGDGTSALVRDARITGGPGWVVIRTDDDRDARVLGATAVAPGRSGPVTVALNGPVPADDDDDLTAVLHLDDGDGVFDESRDPAVLDVDDRDDDFDYRVA